MFLLYEQCYCKFDPDYEILNYISKINSMLPNEIDSSYRFNILVHISMTLMNDKYTAWNNPTNKTS